MAVKAWSLNHWAFREVPKRPLLNKMHPVFPLGGCISEGKGSIGRRQKILENYKALMIFKIFLYLEYVSYFWQSPNNCLPQPFCLVSRPCSTLCHPMDCSLPGSSVHGISHARILASPGSMQDTGCLGLVHWDNPEGWYGEGWKDVGLGFRMGNTCTPMADSCWCWQNQYNIVK